MNSNQYSSLPHTSNNLGGGTGTQRGPFYNGTNTGQQNGPSSNRNYNNKKKYNNRNKYPNNKSNNLNNQAPPQQSFYNNNINDYGCSSLPHTQVNYNNRYPGNQYQQFNKFSINAPDLNSFGNNVPVPKITTQKKNMKRRGGGSNNNYHGIGSFQDNRLNKSLTKDSSLDNSFSEMTMGMPTSLSLDNIGASLSPKMTTSISFHTTSPSRLSKLTQADTILEQEVTETFNSKFTNFTNNLDSGVDSNSYCSMPTIDSHKNYAPLSAELLSSIECDEDEKSNKNTSSLSASSSSPDSQNQNGYETAISQLMTASEGELSFGYDSLDPSQVENTITNLNIEAPFASQIEQAVLENYLQQTSYKSDEMNTFQIEETNYQAIVEVSEDATTSDASDSSENEDSVKDVEHFNGVTTSPQNAENTLLIDEKPEAEVQLNKSQDVTLPMPEKEELNTSQIPEIVVTIALEAVDEQDQEVKEETLLQLIPNLISQCQNETNEKVDEELMSNLRHAEQEVNDLVNKIVLDVIAQAIQVTPTEEVDAVVPEEKFLALDTQTNYMSLDMEISLLQEKERLEAAAAVAEEVKPVVEEVKPVVEEVKAVMEEVKPVVEEAKDIEDMEISFIDNDNSIVYSKAENSLEVIEAAEPVADDATNDILSKTEEILSSSAAKTVKPTNKTVTKEPPVDCFSCTIS